MNLPALPPENLNHLNQLVNALQLPRTVLASDDAINFSWENLPRLLIKVPSEHRNELLARMCIAINAGLFDSAINYIWNAAILALRDKVRSFNLNIVASIKQKDFEEKDLLDLQDSELLQLVLQLNIIDEAAYFFLSQARATRNNYSAAHPSVGMINEYELVAFCNRCIEHALVNPTSHMGFDIPLFLSNLKGGLFNEIQLPYWSDALSHTYDAQQQVIITMMHGMYCDSNTSETTRQNIINVSSKIKDSFSNTTKSSLIDSHSKYQAKGEEEKYKASLVFFETLNLLSLLNQTELHSIFSKAIEKLWLVHNGYHNFYNEPPFAERLAEITQNQAVPTTAQENFVLVVACCYIGNGYGVSNAAIQYYQKMIENFSPLEISNLLNLANKPSNLLGYRISTDNGCKNRFKNLLGLINPASISPHAKIIYDKLIK